MDQSKKTMRHFYCRDVLWETFEQMANDFDCSIDYLINEAMRYYARSKNYQSAISSGAAPGTRGPPTVPPPVAQAPGYQSQPPSSAPGRRTIPPPPPSQPPAAPVPPPQAA